MTIDWFPALEAFPFGQKPSAAMAFYLRKSDTGLVVNDCKAGFPIARCAGILLSS
jgi:hypothetical protein